MEKVSSGCLSTLSSRASEVKIWHLISICYLALIGAGHVVRSKITVGDISHVSFLIFCLCSNDKDNPLFYDERKVIDDLYSDRKGRGAFSGQVKPIFLCDE